METKGDTQHTRRRTGERWSSFSSGTQWRLHCRSLKSPSNASLGLKGVGWGRMNKGWVYAVSALVHFGVFFFFLSLPHWNIFSVCIKCQVNFLGAMRDVSSPSLRVAERWIVAGCRARRCVCMCVCGGELGRGKRGHGEPKGEMRGGGGGASVQYL